MKNSSLFFLFSLFPLFVFYSCQKETLEISKTAEFSKPYKLGFNEVSYLSNEGKNLKVTIMSISDLRCLNEQECDNEGSASVRLNLSDLKNASGETILSISTSHATDSTTLIVDDHKYLIKLLEVTSGFNNTPNTGPVATIEIVPLLRNADYIAL